ncbi:hypothetical protein Tco_1438368 [Tanacetum coccineum]
MLIQHQSEVGDGLERAATTASSLEVEHVSGQESKVEKVVTRLRTSRRVESSADESLDESRDLQTGENIAKKGVSASCVGEVVTTANVDISTASVPITVSTATPTTPLTTTTKDDMTLVETLMEIKSAKPKAIGMVKPKWLKKKNQKNQQREKIRLSMIELAQRLDAQAQAEMRKKIGLQDKEKQEDNIVSWD